MKDARTTISHGVNHVSFIFDSFIKNLNPVIIDLYSCHFKII